MRVFAVDRAENGEHLDPRPINNELRSVVGRLNHLDWWAFPVGGGAAAIEKFGLGAFGRFLRSEKTTDQPVEVSGRQHPGFGLSTSPAVIVKPIPNASGDPWIETFETVDGFLSVDLMSGIESEVGIFVRIGVVVDGAWAMLGAPNAGHTDDMGDTILASGILPVGAGVHRIEMLAAFNNIVFADKTCTFTDRRLVLREVCR